MHEDIFQHRLLMSVGVAFASCLSVIFTRWFEFVHYSPPILDLFASGRRRLELRCMPFARLVQNRMSTSLSER